RIAEKRVVCESHPLGALQHVTGQQVELAHPAQTSQRARSTPGEDRGQWIRRGDRLHVASYALAGHAGGQILADLPAEPEVIRGERRAIVPLDARAELPGDLHAAVVQDSPGAV